MQHLSQFRRRSAICFACAIINLRTNATTTNFQVSQPAFACSKLTIKTLEQDVKYVQS